MSIWIIQKLLYTKEGNIIISIILVALSLAGIAVKILIQKNGQFSGTCASNNPFFNKEGDSYTSRCAGEAVDFGDKGLSKAVTASYKYFLFNALCIPLVGQEFGDADYDHPEDEFEDTDTKQAAPKKGPKKKTIAKTKLKAVEPSKPKVSLAVIQKQIEKDIGYKSICIKPETRDEAGEFDITIEADLDKLREVTKKYMRKHPERKGNLQGLTSGYAKAIELKEKRQKENDEREKQKAS